MKSTIAAFILAMFLGTSFGFPTDEGSNVNETLNKPSDTDSELDDCICVRSYLCSDNTTQNTDKGLIDIAGSSGEKCPHYLQRCCAVDKIIPENKFILPKPVTSSSCGTRFEDAIDIRIEIFDGDEAYYGEFPWMVAVIQTDPNLSKPESFINTYQCGGSLIHPQVVLTAAHCVKGKTNLLIRAGEWDTQTDLEIFPTQDHQVSEVIVHEELNNRSLENDIALLILESPVNITLSNVGLICLPEPNEVIEDWFCSTSGWGKDLYGKEGLYSVIPHRNFLSTMPRDSCVQALRKTRLGPQFQLHESFTCASRRDNTYNTSCWGDSGSPLICLSSKNPSIYIQAGIVAWSVGCDAEIPSVQVNVPYYVNWINDKIETRKLLRH